MTSPVFFDGTGKRRRVVGRTLALLLLLIVGCALGFASTIVNVPTVSPLEFGHEREQPLPFRTRLAHLRHRIPPLPAVGRGREPIRAGFYVPWDEESAASLSAHYDELDWVVASNAYISSKTGLVSVRNDPRLATLVRSHLHRPKLFLMVQNVENLQWFGPPMVRLFHDPKASDRLVNDLIASATRKRWQGVVFDIENLPNTALPAYRDFLARVHPRFAKAGLSVGVTVPAGEPEWDLKRFAAAVDQLYLMNYDQHWQGGESGPIASQDWFAAQLADAQRKVPADKLIIAIGNYGYDWHEGTADALTVNEAWLAAHDSGATPSFDPASGNSGFAYSDEDGHKHTIWMMDAATSWNQLALLRGVSGIALWRLGSEDPASGKTWRPCARTGGRSWTASRLHRARTSRAMAKSCASPPNRRAARGLSSSARTMQSSASASRRSRRLMSSSEPGAPTPRRSPSPSTTVPTRSGRRASSTY